MDWNSSPTKKSSLPSGPVREQVDDLALEPVRVLELVDHDRAEAPALPLAHRGVVAEQVARGELEVLEVERRLAVLRRAVGGAEPVEELLEQVAVARGELVERRLLDAAAGLLVAGRPLARAPSARRGRAAAPGASARPGPRARGPRGRPAPSRRPRRRRPGAAPPRAAPRPARAGRPARRARAPAAARRRAASRGRRSASGGRPGRRRSRAGRAAPSSPSAQNSLERLRRTPRAGARGPARRRGRGSAGRCPPANGCARRSRWQKPWIVEIQAASSSRARSGRPASTRRARMRSRSSPAARSV